MEILLIVTGLKITEIMTPLPYQQQALPFHS
jgi:hypothetical protein